MKIHTLFLAFGSNLGNKEKNILDAYEKIEGRIGKIISRSAFYITEPEGFDSDNRFVNTVCQIETEKEVREVFDAIRRIEIEIGRTSKSANGEYADRVIDIDILMYDNLVIDEPDLIVPHPRFHQRKFVLEPFSEIAPEEIHPVLLKTVGELKGEL